MSDSGDYFPAKALAVDWGKVTELYLLAVKTRTVAFMRFEAVGRIFFGHSHHDAVASYFRHNRCRGNNGNFFIAVYDGFLAKLCRGVKSAIEE